MTSLEVQQAENQDVFFFPLKGYFIFKNGSLD